jgi:predicted amidohydrolase
MKVAAIQFRTDKADILGSRARLAELANEAAEGHDLVVLPEMAPSGYSFVAREDVLAVAETPRGETFEVLSPVARLHQCWLVCGFAERDGDTLYNSAMVISPDGELAYVYRKTLLYEADLHWAQPGDSGYPLLHCGDVRFTVGICMDINDDAFIEWSQREKIRLIAFPTNWIEEGIPVWPYWAWRLRPTSACLVAANGFGKDGPLTVCGQSVILDGRKVLAGAPSAGVTILSATVLTEERTTGSIS